MPHRKDSAKRRIAWGLLAVLSIIALAWSVLSGVERKKYVECNSQQVDLIVKYLGETRLAAAEERASTDEVRRAQLAGDIPAARRAIERYFEVRKQADERRERTKLPALPDTVCGEPRP